jgi:hypothetical protein
MKIHKLNATYNNIHLVKRVLAGRRNDKFTILNGKYHGHITDIMVLAVE